MRLLLTLFFFSHPISYGALNDDKFELALNIAQTASCIAYKKSKSKNYKRIYFALGNKRHKMFNNEGPKAEEKCQGGSTTDAYAMGDNSGWYLCDNSDSDSLIYIVGTVIHETAHLMDADQTNGKQDECKARDHELSILALATGHYEYYQHKTKKCSEPKHIGIKEALGDDDMIDFYEENKNCQIFSLGKFYKRLRWRGK